MIVYHQTNVAAFAGNHVLYWQFQPPIATIQVTDSLIVPLVQNLLYTLYIAFSNRTVIAQGKSLRVTIPVEESNKTVMIQGKSLRTTIPVEESNKTVFIPKQKGAGV